MTAQEVLPFPPTPSASMAGRTMQESVYEHARRAAAAARGCAEHPDRADRRCRARAADARSAARSDTDTLDRILEEGIGFNRFHTTAMCSPTRASLLTGRNHHRIGNGQIAELANDWDGYSGEIPKSSALGAEVLQALRLRHRRRRASGTTRPPRRRPPPDRSTTGRPAMGFEYFYGFLAGEASQYEPNLVRNTTSVLPPRTPEEGYHLSEDLADDAIGWLHRHKAFEPDKPFFMYWASGCLHGPHHVMKEWADKYAGQVRRRLGRLPGAGLRARQGEGLDPAGRRADPAATRRCRRGTTSPRASGRSSAG